MLGPDGAIVIASHSEKAPRSPPWTASRSPPAVSSRRGPRRARTLTKTRASTSMGPAMRSGSRRCGCRAGSSPSSCPRPSFGPIDETIRNAAIGLVLFVLLASLIGILAGRRFVALPIPRVVDDIALIERFELEGVPRRPSWLREIDRLSAALVRMSAGLADFAKFIPTDLVRTLLAEGIRAEPGGARRE